MPTCPNGHESADADYCDVCGALIGGAVRSPSGAPQGGVSPSSAAGSAAGPSGQAASPGQSSSGSSGPMPAGASAAGHAPSAGAAGGGGPGLSPGPDPSPAAGSTATPSGAGDAPCPECGDPRTGRFCETCGYDFTASGTPPRARPTASPQGPTPQPLAPGQWSVTVTADRAYHQAVADRADDDSEEVPFPVYCPERRFALTGGQLLIGRRSRSRGIVPDIDLTGPPEDTGVSHVHALLVATADGWELVDPGSTNGTRLNGAEDPVAENSPVPLSDGDRIHVGAWTTITVHAA
ncbi:FHA domain-containing protein [Longispora urticae]